MVTTVDIVAIYLNVLSFEIYENNQNGEETNQTDHRHKGSLCCTQGAPFVQLSAISWKRDLWHMIGWNRFDVQILFVCTNKLLCHIFYAAQTLRWSQIESEVSEPRTCVGVVNLSVYLSVFLCEPRHVLEVCTCRCSKSRQRHHLLRRKLISPFWK